MPSCFSTILLTVVCILVTANVLNLNTAVAAAGEQKTFHVSLSGSDDNPGNEAKPFASIEKARNAVRKINRDMTGNIVVILHGGTYSLCDTLQFHARDSGTGGHNVVYRAHIGETPVISGGESIIDWETDSDGRWKAKVKIDNFRQLYVNGRRAVRARGNTPTDIELHGEDHGYKTTNAQIATWRNPSDIEFCYQSQWTQSRCKVKSIDRVKNDTIISMLQPHFMHARRKGGRQVELPAYIENALELLDEPGEWYLDRETDTIYYRPLPGEDMQQAEVIVPVVEKLIELRGTLEEPIHNIDFKGITFADAGWLLPSQIGLVDVQATFVLNRPMPVEPLRTVHNEETKSLANVLCHAARNIRFERCIFTRLGGAGINLEYGSQDNVISGCEFYDISGTAIQVGDVRHDDHHPSDDRMIVKDNAITNNYIHDIGVEYQGAVGIFAGYTEATTIAHNEITQLPYTGISVGWGWGEEDAGGSPTHYMPYRYATPTPSKNCLIEYNHIHEVLLNLYDGGGIYTLSNMPGTIIHGNYIHDNIGRPGGIYLDEGSGFIEVTNNRVLSTTPIQYNNLAQNRNDTCKVHANFFGDQPSDRKPNTSKKIRRIIDSAGLTPEYRDLLSH